jgi:hypothetical protein
MIVSSMESTASVQDNNTVGNLNRISTKTAHWSRDLFEDHLGGHLISIDGSSKQYRRWTYLGIVWNGSRNPQAWKAILEDAR